MTEMTVPAVVTILYAPLNFLTSTYLLRLIVDGVRDGTPVGTIVTFIAIIYGINIFVDLMQGMMFNVFLPGTYDRVVVSVQKKLFRRAASMDLSCYETPEFFNKYVKAMDQAPTRVQKVINTLDNLIWRVTYIALSSFLLFEIDLLKYIRFQKRFFL